MKKSKELLIHWNLYPSFLKARWKEQDKCRYTMVAEKH